MEDLSKKPRMKCIIGRWVVVSGNDYAVKLQVPGTTIHFTMVRPPNTDIQYGDRLTVYTEVLLKEKMSASVIEPLKQ